jgi:hypothetical protein
MVRDLEKEFIGTGEVRGFKFKQIDKTEHGYCYEVTVKKRKHYETFKRIEKPICIDFDNKIFSETDKYVVYPSSQLFGLYGKTTLNKEKALTILKNIKYDEQDTD